MKLMKVVSITDKDLKWKKVLMLGFDGRRVIHTKQAIMFVRKVNLIEHRPPPDAASHRERGGRHGGWALVKIAHPAQRLVQAT